MYSKARSQRSIKLASGSSLLKSKNKKNMKRLLFLSSFIAFSFFACEEVPPLVTGSMGPGDSEPPTEQKRQVLIEEFTGVSCIQCPSGSAIIEDLLAIHGPQLIAVSIHSGDFSIPYDDNLYDFRTSEGDALVNFLGQPFGYPSSVVNRRLFENQFDLQLGKDEWAGYVAEEKLKDPKVKIEIVPEFVASTRNVRIDVKLFVQEDITDLDVRLSVMFTENNIVDHQLTPDSSPDTDPNYVHKHVLRDMATSYDGDPITESLIVGTNVTKTFNYTLPNSWDETNTSIIAFVSLGGADKSVLQAHEVHVIE